MDAGGARFSDLTMLRQSVQGAISNESLSQCGKADKERLPFKALALWTTASQRKTRSPLAYSLTVKEPRWILKMVKS